MALALARARLAVVTTIQRRNTTEPAPPPCKADVQQQQHKASLRRMVTSADMKAEDVDKATPSTLTPDQRVAKWSYVHPTSIEWKAENSESQ